MRRMMMLSGLALIAGMGAVSAADDPAAVLQSFADGKPFTATTADGQKFEMVLNPDGTGTIRRDGGKATEGKWRTADGQYCASWGGRPENCFEMTMSGSTVQHMKDGKPAGQWSR